MGGQGYQVGRCSQAGQVEVVLDPVLQRSQLGHLLQLLLAGPAGWHAAEEALQVVGQGLQESTPMRGTHALGHPITGLCTHILMIPISFASGGGVAYPFPGFWGKMTGMRG